MGTISINGKKAGSGRLEKTIPFIYGTETADLGMDLYSAVSHDTAKGDNDFNGEIKR
jgi:arylsulfatase